MLVDRSISWTVARVLSGDSSSVHLTRSQSHFPTPANPQQLARLPPPAPPPSHTHAHQVVLASSHTCGQLSDTDVHQVTRMFVLRPRPRLILGPQSSPAPSQASQVAITTGEDPPSRLFLSTPSSLSHIAYLPAVVTTPSFPTAHREDTPPFRIDWFLPVAQDGEAGTLSSSGCDSDAGRSPSQDSEGGESLATSSKSTGLLEEYETPLFTASAGRGVEEICDLVQRVRTGDRSLWTISLPALCVPPCTLTSRSVSLPRLLHICKCRGIAYLLCPCLVNCPRHCGSRWPWPAS